MSETASEHTSKTHEKQATRVAESPKSNDRKQPPKYATEKVRTKVARYEPDGNYLKIYLDVGRANGVYPFMKARFIGDGAQNSESFEIRECDENKCWALVRETGDFVNTHDVEIQPIPKQKLPLPKKR